MVARTRLIVALYLHCLSCFIYYVQYHKLQFAATSHGQVLPVHRPCENNTTNSRYLRTYITFFYFQLVTPYLVFIAHTCFGHKIWPSSGRYMFLRLIQRILSLFVCLFLCFGATAPQWARSSSFTRFLDHTQRRTTVGRTPLDE